MGMWIFRLCQEALVTMSSRRKKLQVYRCQRGQNLTMGTVLLKKIEESGGLVG